MPQENNNVVKFRRSDVVDKLMVSIKEFQQNSSIVLPKNYSYENALNAAFLIIPDVKNIGNASPQSVQTALFKMVTRGLDPARKQCDFIVRGTTLCCDPSYFGNEASAKRAGMKEVNAQVIYEKDEFVYSIDNKTGKKKVEKHSQEFANIDITKIKGAYAITVMENGESDLTIMTIQQIRQAWMQGATKGNSGAHNNFTDEMAKRTVINRACKHIINSSNDAFLYTDKNGVEEETEITPEDAAQVKETIEFEAATVIDTSQTLQGTEKSDPPIEAKVIHEEKTTKKVDDKVGGQGTLDLKAQTKRGPSYE